MGQQRSVFDHKLGPRQGGAFPSDLKRPKERFLDHAGQWSQSEVDGMDREAAPLGFFLRQVQDAQG
jgi:hypothetical protein